MIAELFLSAGATEEILDIDAANRRKIIVTDFYMNSAPRPLIHRGDVGIAMVNEGLVIFGKTNVLLKMRDIKLLNMSALLQFRYESRSIIRFGMHPVLISQWRRWIESSAA